VPNRVSRSVCAEDTFPEGGPLSETEEQIRLWRKRFGSRRGAIARGLRTVVLKLKTKEFNSLTRSLTPSDTAVFLTKNLPGLVRSLRERVDLGPTARYQLVGVGLIQLSDR
jgi:DNA polymerase IV